MFKSHVYSSIRMVFFLNVLMYISSWNRLSSFTYSLFFNLTVFKLIILYVISLSLSVSSFFFYSQGTINLRGSMKELLLEQQLETLNRFRSGTLRRWHRHRMTDRQTVRRHEQKRTSRKEETKKRYLILILRLVWCCRLLTHLSSSSSSFILYCLSPIEIIRRSDRWTYHQNN